MSRRPPRRPGTPLEALRPTPGRTGAVGVAVVATAAFCWFVGVEPSRAAGLCAVVALLVLVVRVEDTGEDRWPQPPAPRSRPGRQEVASTTRQLEAARTDAADRAVVLDRLTRLGRATGDPASGAGKGTDADPGLPDDVRAAIGVPRRAAGRAPAGRAPAGRAPAGRPGRSPQTPQTPRSTP